MELNCKAVICVSIVVLYGLTIVCSLPVGKREALPTADQEPITFNKLLPPLIDLSSSDSLFSLWKGAFDLSDENLLKAEVSFKKYLLSRDRYCTHAHNVHVVILFAVSAKEAQGVQGTSVL